MESLLQAKHLKMLVLKGDYIATDTMLALADALGTNRTLEGLAVGATFPDEEVGPALGKALAVIASLKTVVLEGDLVGDATGLAVAGALKSNRTLINLAVHGDLLCMPWIPGEHRRGIRAVECVIAHLRGGEEVSE